MKHCIFCSTEFDDDTIFCPRCRDYKGIESGPAWEDNRDRADDEIRAEMLADDDDRR